MYDCVRLYESRLAREESVPVITSANGLKADDWQVNDEAESVAFMGVAMSRALHDSRNAARNEEDCTVQVGGLCTILNNGGDNIKAGEWVAWDYPEPDMFLQASATAGDNLVANENAYREPTLGTPHTKCQFRVRSYNEMLKAMTTPKKSCDKNRLGQGEDAIELGFMIGTKAELHMDVFKAHKILRRIEGRIFGRAMSSASRGEPVDILLGAHCV